jgi:hypothetical protein
MTRAAPYRGAVIGKATHSPYHVRVPGYSPVSTKGLHFGMDIAKYKLDKE